MPGRLARTLSIMVAVILTGLIAPFWRTEVRAVGTDHYVSPSGSDAASGTSPASAWQTIARVNAATFGPGDRILFEGGQTFAGGLDFDQADRGTAADPIIIGTYGTGRATIQSGTRSAIYAYNTAGFRMSGLNLVGSGRTTNGADGIAFYTDLPGDVKLERVHIDDVQVSGFGAWGIAVGGWNGRSGYRDVRITNVVARDNARGGISTYGELMYSNEGVYVGQSRASDNPGIPGFPGNTGNGIVLGSVSAGTVERPLAYNNGWLCDATDGGPVGIWAYDSTRVTLQFNESYDNRTGGPTDGGGFDLDENTSDSVMQFNYSHGNDGAGYLLAHAPDNLSFTGNVVRFNVSQDDGRKNYAYGGIHLWGRIRNTEIYNNTIYVSPSATGSPRGISILDWTIEGRDVSGVHLRNNVIQTTGGVPLLEVSQGQVSGGTDLLFQGNAYFSSGAPFGVIWGTTSHASLAAWRAATGQERVGGADVGLNVDPRLEQPGGGGTIGDPTQLATLSAYRLRADSPLIDAGLDLAARFGVVVGPIDYFGGAIPRGAGPDIGAHEAPAVSGGATPTPTATAPSLTATPSATPTQTPSPTTTASPTATATSTAAATATATPPSVACAPRPPVLVEVQRPDAHTARVKVALGTTPGSAANAIRAIELAAGDNALVDIGDQRGISSAYVYRPSPAPREVSFTVRRASPGRAATLPLVVDDGCGS